LVGLLSSTLHFGMYYFIACLCLYLFTVFVVAHPERRSQMGKKEPQSTKSTIIGLVSPYN
jgi:hypothetical protein